MNKYDGTMNRMNKKYKNNLNYSAKLSKRSNIINIMYKIMKNNLKCSTKLAKKFNIMTKNDQNNPQND